jgi:DNA-binding response OmpR family regulator
MKDITVLIIDDDRNFLETTKDVLERDGVKAVTLDDPRKAEVLIEKERPDVLILDILMPKRSGFKIVEELTEQGLYGDIPKIFMTIMDDNAEKLVADAEGVSEYLVKPFDPKALIDAIHRCMKKKKNRRV